MSFLTDFETDITGTFASNGAFAAAEASLTMVFQGAFISGMTIWIAMVGWEVAYGKTEDGMAYILTKIGKMTLTGIFAFWTYGAVKELMIGVQEGFVAGASGGAGATLSTVLDTSIVNPLTFMYGSIMDAINASFGVFSFTSPAAGLGLIFTGLLFLLAWAVVAVVAMGLAIVTMAMYFVSYATFLILLALGPFFLMCMAFPFLQKFFEAWVGSVATSIFAMGILVLLVNVSAAMLGLNTVAGHPAFAPATGADLTVGAIPGLMISKAGTALLLTYLYFKVFDLASALGSGMNLGGTMTGAMRTLSRMSNKGGASGGNSSGGGAVARTGTASLAAASTRAALSNAAHGGAQSLIRGASNVGRGVAQIGSHSASAGRYAYNRGISSLRSRFLSN